MLTFLKTLFASSLISKTLFTGLGYKLNVPSKSNVGIDKIIDDKSNTLTWPELPPFPSLNLAPITTTLPSAEMSTELPDSSLADAPFIDRPTCVQTASIF